MAPVTCTLVVFGITGNLSRLKIIPALYDLFSHNVISPDSRIIGIGRKPYSSTEGRDYFTSVLKESRKKENLPLDPEIVSRLGNQFNYLSGDLTSEGLYPALKEMLEGGDMPGNIMYYLAVFPSMHERIFTLLKEYDLTTSTRDGWVRVMVEKPIGNDLSSAMYLTSLMGSYFDESQIFRLDHYLGKEVLQNVLTFRFGNGLLEPLFTHEYIDHIQITSAEQFGVGERGQYYDNSGALKDVGQNHILQMLTAVTMDAPAAMTNEAVTRERVKVLQALNPTPEFLVKGQYEGYTSEPHINPTSETDTFFALRTSVDTPRFQGVPIYIRAGKMLASTVTEIAIVFRNPTNRLFAHLEQGNEPNVLLFRIQPDEGIVFQFLSRKPGRGIRMMPSAMQFCYSYQPERLSNPYELLIADALNGDQTFFNDPPEIEAQWKFIDALTAPRIIPVPYLPGSWGPSAAEELLNRDNRNWLEPSPNFCARPPLVTD